MSKTVQDAIKSAQEFIDSTKKSLQTEFADDRAQDSAHSRPIAG